MSGLCGWSGKDNEYPFDQDILQHMADKLLSVNAHEFDQTGSENHALAIAKAVKPCSLYHEEGLSVAVLGNLSWDSDAKPTENMQESAAIVANLYRQAPDDFLTQLDGSFALAIIDDKNEQSLLAVDRLGIERMCFSIRDQQIIFGTNTSSMLSYPGSENSINPQSIFNYLYFHVIPAPNSIYKNISKLLPGEFVKFKRGSIERAYYWHLDYQENTRSSIDQLASEFKQCLNHSVLKVTRNYPQYGAFLSGGTDSSSMAAVMSKVSSSPVKTFSMGFDAPGYDETEYARITAKRFHTEHKEYYVTPADVFDAIPLVAQTYDEPFGNASAIPTYYCARFARENGVQNIVAGDGGDELFAGNKRYSKQKKFSLYQHIPDFLRNNLLEPVFTSERLAQMIPLASRLKSYIEQARIPLPDRLETYNFLHRDRLETIFSPDFLSQINTDHPLSQIRTEFRRAQTPSDLNRMLFLDLKFTLADNDLRKVNEMCELGGVNVHYPLLENRVLDFSAKLPTALKLKGHQLRYFFKYALKDTLAPETLSKSKHGFGLPFGLWLKEYEPLHKLAFDSLQSLKQRNYLNPDYISQLWQQYENGDTSYYGVMIWVLMMLEQWFQHHIDQ